METLTEAIRKVGRLEAQLRRTRFAYLKTTEKLAEALGELEAARIEAAKNLPRP